jgi:acetoacetate decarboxylase
MPFHTPWYQGPLHYPNAEMIQVIFTPTAECIERILPKPLKPGLLGGAYLANFKTSPFGPIWEASVVVQCTYKDRYGVYTVCQYTDSDVSVAAHREIWGFPSKLAGFKYRREGDHITARVVREKAALLSFDVKLTGPGDWIETGAAINLKLIPGVDGKSYAIKQITAANLAFVIHEGKAGDGVIKFGRTDKDPLADILQLENTVAGTWFRIDLTCPYGEVIGQAKIAAPE